MAFADLRQCISNDTLPPVSIVGVGAFPIIYDQDMNPTLLGQIVTPESLRLHLIQALGLGAVLTFRNPKNKTLEELGGLCLKLDHLWTFHTVTLTVAFNEAPIAVRNAFSFDRRFHLSWVEREQDVSHATFTATGSLKEWKKIQHRSSSRDFQPTQRAWFGLASDLIAPCLPEYFGSPDTD